MSDTIETLPKPLRDERGRLLPGQTANPLGRPAKAETFSRRSVIELCAERGYHPVDEMIRIARDPSATPYIQLEVAKEIASYIIPKVKQVQITNADGDADGQIKISWDIAPQTIEKAQKNDDLAAEQFKTEMQNATQTILDGVAEAVLEDDDDEQG